MKCIVLAAALALTAFPAAAHGKTQGTETEEHHSPGGGLGNSFHCSSGTDPYLTNVADPRRTGETDPRYHLSGVG